LLGSLGYKTAKRSRNWLRFFWQIRLWRGGWHDRVKGSGQFIGNLANMGIFQNKGWY
jgi:hypothetical protein